MRTAVGHLTRNIKISGDGQDGWGGHLLVYEWIYYNDVTKETSDFRGSMILNGVELNNMGQADSEKAGIHIIYTNSDGDLTKI